MISRDFLSTKSAPRSSCHYDLRMQLVKRTLEEKRTEQEARKIDAVKNNTKTSMLRKIQEIENISRTLKQNSSQKPKVKVDTSHYWKKYSTTIPLSPPRPKLANQSAEKIEQAGTKTQPDTVNNNWMLLAKPKFQRPNFPKTEGLHEDDLSIENQNIQEITRLITGGYFEEDQTDKLDLKTLRKIKRRFYSFNNLYNNVKQIITTNQSKYGEAGGLRPDSVGAYIALNQKVLNQDNMRAFKRQPDQPILLDESKKVSFKTESTLNNTAKLKKRTKKHHHNRQHQGRPLAISSQITAMKNSQEILSYIATLRNKINHNF